MTKMADTLRCMDLLSNAVGEPRDWFDHPFGSYIGPVVFNEGGVVTPNFREVWWPALSVGHRFPSRTVSLTPSEAA
jgi:hypothetical protein